MQVSLSHILMEYYSLLEGFINCIYHWYERCTFFGYLSRLTIVLLKIWFALYQFIHYKNFECTEAFQDKAVFPANKNNEIKTDSVN